MSASGPEWSPQVAQITQIVNASPPAGRGEEEEEKLKALSDKCAEPCAPLTVSVSWGSFTCSAKATFSACKHWGTYG